MIKFLCLMSIFMAVGLLVSAQKIHMIETGAPIDKKVKAALRYDYELTDKENADYQIEVFFTGKYSLGKGYKGYYKLYDKSGKELYRSQEWKSGGYGGAAENYIVKKVVSKDLPKVISELK